VPFNLSMTHLMVVAIVALIVLGPDRLPSVAKTIGQFYREYKRIRGDLEMEAREVINEFKEPFLEHIETVKDVVNDFRQEAGNLTGAAASGFAAAGAAGPAPPIVDLPLLPGAEQGGGPAHPAPLLGPVELPSLAAGSSLVSPGPPGLDTLDSVDGNGGAVGDAGPASLSA